MENFHSIFTKLKLSYTKLIVVALIAIAGLILFAYGLIGSMGKSQPQDDLQFTTQMNVATESGKISQNTLTVDVSGAVVNPGLYHIAQDARVQDALIAAGGLSDTADRVWVAKSLNLARKLSDGAKVYIPATGEVAGAQTQSAGLGSPATQSVDAPGESSTVATININDASLDALDTLPGVGKVTAQKIVDNRPYSDINELLSKKVVGASVFGKIKDRISVN